MEPNKKELPERIEADPKQDILRYIYRKSKEKAMTESEALQRNLTEIFWAWARDKIKAREFVCVGLLGEVRGSKSTCNLKIMYELNKHMEKIGLNPGAMKKIHKYIFSDQTEFLRFINEDERNAALTIDEFNRMAETGLNATTEDALFDHYSDVFAGQYLHRIISNPNRIVDKNTTVILEYEGKDEEQRMSRWRLKYRDIITQHHMTIGYVDIYVGDIISNWIDKGIRDIVEKRGIKTIEEQRYVDEWSKKDFYIAYQVKKYKRMELTKKHGVRDIRDLEFSVIILQVMQELEDLAKIKRMNKELIDTVTDEVVKQNKRIYSILTLNEISNRAKAILNLYHEINDLEKRMNRNKNPAEVLVYKKTIAQTTQLLENRLREQRKYSQVYKEYMNIE